jgi:hypothetical protein
MRQIVGDVLKIDFGESCTTDHCKPVIGLGTRMPPSIPRRRTSTFP